MMINKILKILIDIEGLGIEEWQEIVNYLTDLEKENNQLKLQIQALIEERNK